MRNRLAYVTSLERAADSADPQGLAIPDELDRRAWVARARLESTSKRRRHDDVGLQPPDRLPVPEDPGRVPAGPEGGVMMSEFQESVEAEAIHRLSGMNETPRDVPCASADDRERLEETMDKVRPHGQTKLRDDARRHLERCALARGEEWDRLHSAMDKVRPSGLFEVSFDHGTTWAVGYIDSRTLRLLCRAVSPNRDADQFCKDMRHLPRGEVRRIIVIGHGSHVVIRSPMTLAGVPS